MDALTKLLLAFSGLLTLMLGVVLYLVLFSAPDGAAPVPAEVVAAASDDAVITCDASSLEGAVCPSNYYCRFDRCVPVEAPPACAEGDSCRDCECEEGLVCHQFRCVDVTRVDRTPLICEKNKRLADAVKQLADKCAERRKDVDDIVSSGSCSPKDWEHLALEDDKFDLLLSAFPHRFAVHFESGKPPLRGRDWPPSKVRSHYLEQIRRFRESLFGAKQIFVIGRASPDGSAETNHLLALRRMNLVSQLIESVVYEGMTESERDMHRIRIRSFTLPTAEPIQPDRYRDTYLKNPEGTEPLEIEPLMTWDEASLAALHAELDDPALLSAKSGRQWQDLYSMINRVVLVIPIPCLGNEYKAAPSDLMPLKEGAG